MAAVLLFFLVGRNLQSLWVRSVCKALPVSVLAISLIFSFLKERKNLITARFSIAALCFSMAGDIFGEMRGCFIFQIVSFSLAQIMYATSFASHLKFDKSTIRNIVRGVLCPILVTYLVLFARYVLPFINAGPVKTAILWYIVLIGVMGLLSALQCRKGWWWFICGALLFIASDSMIVWRSYAGYIPYAGWLIMTTYYAAQLCLTIPLLKQNESN